MNSEKLYRKYVFELARSPFSWYSSDGEPGRDMETEIRKRNKEYSKLLESYVKVTKTRNILKEIHKWIFFWLVIGACWFGLRLTYKIVMPILQSDDSSFIISSIPVIIAALVSFISTVIAVPLTITNFLFNTKEEDNITDLIKHTQEHDAAGITLLKERFLRKGAKGAKAAGGNPPSVQHSASDSD